MRYRATKDSFTNQFFYRDRVYTFTDKAPNSHFECLDDTPQKPDPKPPAEKDEILLEMAAERKQKLLDLAYEKGIEVDKRWGVKKIREAIEQEG